MPTLSISRFITILFACLLFTGCSDDNSPKPAKPSDNFQEAISRVGDVTIRANLVRTLNLSTQVASDYGIERRENDIMLLVSVRQGPDAQETALPATITASVTGLLGEHREMPMREVRTGEWVDYIGIVEVSSPDTLRFDLNIERENGATSQMQFTRDFTGR